MLGAVLSLVTFMQVEISMFHACMTTKKAHYLARYGFSYGLYFTISNPDFRPVLVHSWFERLGGDDA